MEHKAGDLFTHPHHEGTLYVALDLNNMPKENSLVPVLIRRNEDKNSPIFIVAKFYLGQLRPLGINISQMTQTLGDKYFDKLIDR